MSMFDKIIPISIALNTTIIFLQNLLFGLNYSRFRWKQACFFRILAMLFAKRQDDQQVVGAQLKEDVVDYLTNMRFLCA